MSILDSSAAKQLFVCLAAGKGTRMGRLSSYLQKCMYPLDGIPFVEYTLNEVASLADGRTTHIEVLFVLGHHGKQVEAYFGSQYHNLSLTYVRQNEQKGTADAVRTAFEARPCAQNAVVWLADSFFPASTFDALLDEPRRNAVTLVRADSQESFHHRVEVSDGLVSRAWYGTGAYIDAGLWKLERGVLSSTREGSDGEYRMLHALNAFIENDGKVGYVEAPSRVHLAGVKEICDDELRRAIDKAVTREPIR